jgi:hypothetical protein
MPYVIAHFVTLAVSMAVLICVLPREGDGFVGACLFALGAANLLLYRKGGRGYFRQTQRAPSQLAQVWAFIGERGTQLLFLGTGIILAAAGCVLVVLGFAWR